MTTARPIEGVVNVEGAAGCTTVPVR